MAITDVTSVVQNQTSQDSTQTRGELSESDFLKMFTTQMQYQDPLNPLDATQFTSQLAQFSSLDQLFKMSSSLTQLLQAGQTMNSMAALKLIGKEIQANGNSLVLQEGSAVTGSFSLASAATQCTVSIYDGSGTLVRTLSLGALSGGEGQFSWDGLSATGKTMPSGTYTYKMQAKDLDGKDVQVQARTSGVVTGVKLGGTEPQLSVGVLDLPLSSVTAVTDPA
jgi:flagellar basal-body rod modification protein FlgD